MRTWLAIGAVCAGLLCGARAEAQSFPEARALVVAASEAGAYRCRGVDLTLWHMLNAAEQAAAVGDVARCLLILETAHHCVTAASRTGLVTPTWEVVALHNERARFVSVAWADLIAAALEELAAECGG